MKRNILTLPVQRFVDHEQEPVQDLVAVEEPLEIRLNGRSVSITMRTPGNDFELAAGFLFTEGILTHKDQIREIRYVDESDNPRQRGNTVALELHESAEPDLGRLERHFYMTSSCGVCGKASIDALESTNCPILARDSPLVGADCIHSLPEALRKQQAVFDRTGGLHAAALFDATGNLLSVREDVGRHNAVDKLIGAEMLAGHVPCSENLILVSGRASFELVQKTLMGGIPILTAVGAPSSLAVEAAQRFGMTLVGFLRDRRFNIYSGAHRIR